jgi:hypothetical protein
MKGAQLRVLGEMQAHICIAGLLHGSSEKSTRQAHRYATVRITQRLLVEADSSHDRRRIVAHLSQPGHERADCSNGRRGSRRGTMRRYRVRFAKRGTLYIRSTQKGEAHRPPVWRRVVSTT